MALYWPNIDRSLPFAAAVRNRRRFFCFLFFARRSVRRRLSFVVACRRSSVVSGKSDSGNILVFAPEARAFGSSRTLSSRKMKAKKNSNFEREKKLSRRETLPIVVCCRSSIVDRRSSSFVFARRPSFVVARRRPLLRRLRHRRRRLRRRCRRP